MIKVKIFDTELWHSNATKAVDSEREKKKQKDNGYLQGTYKKAQRIQYKNNVQHKECV